VANFQKLSSAKGSSGSLNFRCCVIWPNCDFSNWLQRT